MRRIRDPVHGFIHLSQDELKLVETRAFRRLRNIKQLALTYLVYPGAMHTRFEHSLGVMELATMAFDAVSRRSSGQLEANFKKLGWKTEQARALLRTTALLHDVGHLPFSHTGEDILPTKEADKRVTHEDVSIAIIRENEIASILEDKFYSGIVEHVALLLDENREVPPELLILKKILSGQFDADKMDYLLRDSLHCGVGYGNFDYLRLLETLLVKEAPEGGLELCLERGGIHTLEAMMLARYWMFTQVYYHKTRRIYGLYLSRYLKEWYENQYEDLLGILKHDDLSLMQSIRYDADTVSENPGRREYARRILYREHHRVVYETGNHADIKDRRVAGKLQKSLEEHYPGLNFILDGDASGIVHKFYVKGDEEEGDEFFIYDAVARRYSRLSEQSRIFEKMPKRFQVVRIYADIPKDSLPQYREFATAKAQEIGEAM